MRIVITKNGKIIIREINPEVKYKNLLTSHNQFMSRRFGNQSKLSHSRNNSFGNTSNNLSIHNKNLNIDDVLSNVQSNKKNIKSTSQCKILNLEPNKHLMLPQSIADRYFEDQSSLEIEDKNLLPDVFVSINKSIEKDANTKGFNYIYNNISSLQTMHDKEIEENLSRKKSLEDNSSLLLNTEQNDMGRYSTTFNLPKILPAYPLKYIINPYTIKNIKKEAKLKEYELKKGKRLTEDNFRSKVIPDPRYNLELSLKNEIKIENTNLITYLNKSKDIKAPFVERLSMYDNEQIKKLNKISQKTMFIKGQEKIISDKIRNKIKGLYRQSSEEYKKGLETLKEKLNRYENIVKAEEKKIIDKRERYLNQYNEAEKYWVKSNALRFYKKSDPPKNSATALVIEK
jgi:hypothetical protein